MCKPAKWWCASLQSVCVHGQLQAEVVGLLGCISSPVNYICLMLHAPSLARLGLEPRALTPSPLSLPKMLLRSSVNRNWSSATDSQNTQEMMVYTSNMVSPLNLWDRKKRFLVLIDDESDLLNSEEKYLYISCLFYRCKKKKYHKVAVNENKSTVLVA